jgi:hypothetical protein
VQEYDYLGFIKSAFEIEPFMAILHFFCDESGKYRKNPLVAVSGLGAAPGRLIPFSDDWRALLRSYEIGDELHMSRIADLTQACGHRMPSGQTLNERIETLKPFADCINRHMEIGFMQAWDVKGYNRLSLDVKKALGGSPNPHHLIFVRSLLAIMQYAGPEGRVSIIVDDDELTSWDTYVHYRSIAKALPEIAPQIAALTFAKSQHFPALQAADMVAFLVRKEASARFYGTVNEFKELLDYMAQNPPLTVGLMRWFNIFLPEEELVRLGNDVLNGNAPAVLKNGKVL